MSPAPQLRKVTQAAVGVVQRDDGAVLLADRPAGKPYAGYWEFPGGKIEHGEPAADALRRELHEELGIDVESSTPWLTFEFDYPHAYVRLHFHRVRHWHGEPHAREGQRLLFVQPKDEGVPQPLLPAAVPALRWLRLPETLLLVSKDSALPEAGDGALPGGRPAIVVVDADWHQLGSAALIPRWRRFTSAAGGLLLATGRGAEITVDVDGTLTDLRDRTARSSTSAHGWRGLWVDRVDGEPAATAEYCDFLLSRQPTAAARLDGGSWIAVPVFFPACLAASQSAAPAIGHGLWTDLRS